MRVAVIGPQGDAQGGEVTRHLEALGAQVVQVRAQALEAGLPVSEADGRTSYLGVDLEDVEGVYLRSVPAGVPPAVEEDGELRLLADWHARAMQQRERWAFWLAWFLKLQHRGVRLINPPQATSLMQFKAFQLHVLRSLGARVPRTLISNDPQAVRAFHAQVGPTIFKPVTGGAFTRLLDEETLGALEALRAAPVIFQERVDGDDVRVMLAGDDVVSAVAIRTPRQHLDFRADPVYADGTATYEPVEVPEGVLAFCRRAARACGLVFAGLDLKHTAAGDWVFLELNSSPVYLDVERKLGHPISRAIAELVVGQRSFAAGSRG